MRLLSAVVGMAVAMTLGGCASGGSDWLPSTDKDLRKEKEQFIAEAAARSYPADAPQAGLAPVRASIDYGLDVINLVNLSDQPLDGVEVWVNRQYGLALTQLPPREQRTVNFRMLFDKTGQQAPSQGLWIDTVELLHQGQLYQVRAFAAD